MSQPIVGTLPADLQAQSQSSGLITVFEIEVPNSDIGGAGQDKLYFHDGVTTDLATDQGNIKWYTLLDDNNFGSTSTLHYGEQLYTSFPLESEGWEVRGTGSLPRPSVRFANINQYWSAHLSNYDDLVGAKVIRRRTLEKYLIGGTAAANPPVEFNRDVYYIERKTTETATMVEFELASAFDVQGIQLPRRAVIAARCPWKYKDPEQGGCDWPVDSRPSDIPGHSATVPLYFDKDDNRISTHSTWGSQDEASNRTTNLYAATSYSVGNYVEYHRPIGGLIAASAVTSGANAVFTVGSNHEIDTGDFIIAKGFTDEDANFKSVPLYVSNAGATTITVQSPSKTITSSSGYLQLTRVTLYKCITAHSIATGDDADEIIKPTNISYWEFGDVCGKRLTSCAKRYGHEPSGTSGVTSITVDKGNGVIGGGSGYTSAPSVTISAPPTALGNTTATATASIKNGKVYKLEVTYVGTGYTTAPSVSFSGGGGSGATATAHINVRGTRNVSLPFGGFPGAALG